VLDNEENGESMTAMAEDEGFWAVETSRSCKGLIRFGFHTDVEMKKHTIKKTITLCP